MKRTSLRLLLAVLVAVFTFGSLAEAAPRKPHHRAKHSSRVSTSTSSKRHGAKKHSSTHGSHHHSTKPR